MMHKVALVRVSSPLGILFQTHLTLPSGEQKMRAFGNVSETLELDELPLEGAIRGLKEELNLNISSSRLSFVSSWSERKPSPTTGEMKSYKFWLFKLELTLEEAKSIPLIIKEGDNLCHFEWVPVSVP